MQHPMISSRTMSGLSDGIREAAGAIVMERALSSADLPRASLRTQRAYIPQLRQLGFFEVIARHLGTSTLALEIGPSASITEYGVFGDYVTEQETFGGALRVTTDMMQFHSSHDRLMLTHHQDEVVFAYHAAVKHAIGYQHYAGLALTVMLSIARPYFTTNKIAKSVEFDCPPPSSQSVYEDFFGCPVRFGCPTLAVKFDRHLLDQPRRTPSTRLVTLSDVTRSALVPAPTDTVGAVQSLIRLGINDGGVGMEQVADQLGLGQRTLRRRLDAAGITYRDLVAKTRIERARELLTETNLPIGTIALMTGYADTSNFDRAFRRLTGLTPKVVRRLGN